MKFAYADPPYLGTARKTYGAVHEDAEDFDDPAAHAELIERLQDEYDGWALSLNEPSLRVLLPMAPAGVRVAAWISQKPKFPPGIAVTRHWEPVIFSGGRDGKRRCGDYHLSISCGIRPPEDRPILPRGAPGGIPTQTIAAGREHFGRKPRDFAFWIFALLGVERGDEFRDLFPGHGGVSAAWEEFNGERPQRELVLQPQGFKAADVMEKPGDKQ